MRTLFILFFILPGTALSLEEVLWQTVELNGSKIGHRQIVREVEADRVVTTERLVITLQQPGEDPRTTESTLVYRETTAGEPLSLEKTLQSNSANHRMTAVVDGDVLRVVRDHGENQDRQVISIPHNFRLREGQRVILAAGQGDTRRIRYHGFNFSAMRFEHYQLLARRQDDSWLLERRRLVPASATVTTLTMDQHFQLLEERSVSSGEPLVLKTCDRDCALQDFFPVTHVYRQLIRSPFRIPESALRGHIRYTLTGEHSLQPPSTFEQRVVRTEQGWQVDICADCGDESAPTPRALARNRQSGYWITVGHPELKAALEHVIDGESTAAEIMPKLARFVSLSMDEQPDYSGFGTALEALRRQRGDCTEHALLLAALARTAGFAARVAIGIAYTNERFLGRNYVFVPHAWVQVWDGERWRSYDSALGDFTSGYIVLALSDDGELADFTAVNQQLHQLNLAHAVHVK